MAIILSIDTALESSGIALSREEEILEISVNHQPSGHAGWLQPAIARLLHNNGLDVPDLDAVAVVAGPGSYTGLRIGMASAKGLCYALKIPLIVESTLKVMTAAALPFLKEGEWACPMIDARRLEVFTALYNASLNEIQSPAARILVPGMFDEFLQQHSILFFGNGSFKWKELCPQPCGRFEQVHYDAGNLVPLALHKFRQGIFEDLAYSEPAYLKEFHTHHRK